MCLFQHLFSSSHFTELHQKMMDMAVKCIGIGIKVLKDPITLDEFCAQRLGKFRFVRLYNFIFIYKLPMHVLSTQFVWCKLRVQEYKNGCEMALVL